MSSEMEEKVKVLRSMGISETRISELLGASEKDSLETPTLNQEGIQRLKEALEQKERELILRERNLASPYYADDEWTKKQITHLKTHISQIQGYLNGEHDLQLPRCCRHNEYICLIAIRGFDFCIMVPTGCGFSLKF